MVLQQHSVTGGCAARCSWVGHCMRWAVLQQHVLVGAAWLLGERGSWSEHTSSTKHAAAALTWQQARADFVLAKGLNKHLRRVTAMA